MASSRSRSMKELVFWLVVDFFFVVWMGIQLMNTIHAHTIGSAVFSGLIWVIWVGMTYRDLDRWTGPKRVKRHHTDVS